MTVFKGRRFEVITGERERRRRSDMDAGKREVGRG